MGKTKKAHRKKVENRNKRISQQQKMVERMFLDFSKEPQPQSNFITLTGSDHQKYVDQYLNDNQK